MRPLRLRRFGFGHMPARASSSNRADRTPRYAGRKRAVGGAVDIQPWHAEHPYKGDAADGETRKLDCGSLGEAWGAVVFLERLDVGPVGWLTLTKCGRDSWRRTSTPSGRRIT